MRDHDELSEVMGEYRAGQIGRREFLRRVGIIGLSSLAAGTLLAGAGRAYAQAPASGGTLIEGYDRDFSPIDPVKTAWADPAMNAIYEPLVTHDYEGKIVPFLALAYNEATDRWTFDIPTDRTYHSGAPVTADNVARALQAMISPDTGQNASFYSQVDTVSADGNTVVVALKSPKAGLAEVLSTEYAYIPNIDRRNEIGAGTFGAQEADGSGPFKLAEYTTGSKVRVEKWAEYPGQGASHFENRGPAHLDAVEWVPVLEPSQRAPEIETGSVLAIKNPPAADVARLKSNPDLVVIEFPEPSNFFLLPSMKRTDLEFDKVEVRQALSGAIDRAGIVQAILGGGGEPTQGPASSSWRFYEPAVEQFNQYDPEKSAATLEAAGWVLGPSGVREKNGVKMEFTAIHVASPIEIQVMSAIAAMFQEIGVVMHVESLEIAAFREKRPTADMFGFKWLWSVQADIIPLFMRLFQPNDHPDVAAILEAFRIWENTVSDEEMREVTSKAQLLAAELAVTLPVYTPYAVWVHHKKVHGWRPTPYGLYPFYNDVWIEQ
ncbi:ABC transporter substrate-binding protein [Devosia sp.]|uniref:ABC transporter substrate-binding protein n=1 Tax=Devosia sp. TaxID=1871048 RepID=UPI002F0EA312